ncbi:sensor histidine kinase [Streptacidiphilus albus]|uniref:sensor histidine kinase n=1 Tax=Streptacidiphilus albus TaxID=105425 RepID=UPI001F2AE11A|nr:HAMP domain-containing sensor histidine kinase [Streptacidiphilus albus]
MSDRLPLGLRLRLPRLLRRRPTGGLRVRFSVAFAGVAALVAILVGGLGYDAAASLIRRDRAADFSQSLTALRSAVKQSPLDPKNFLPSKQNTENQMEDEFTQSGDIGIQILGPGGDVLQAGSPDRLHVSTEDKVLTREHEAGAIHDVTEQAGQGHYRVVTVSLGGGRGAVQLSQLLSTTDQLLGSLLVRIELVAAGVVLAAGASGWWLAGRITQRLVSLTGAAEHVASTGQLDVDVPRSGVDEIGRLGRAFDDMLGRLARSKDDQRRLVQDAGHELRTPLTSLRTNIAALPKLDLLPEESRYALLDDLQTETRELTVLVNELVELAADRREAEEPTEVDLGALAERVADLARRRSGREIVVAARPAFVSGRPQALQRALTNLVENAAKFATGDSQILVRVESGRVAVLDRGPGIDEGDLDRVFNRFYRATRARSLPGSGLGLSIVREVAESHGGRVFARNRPGGGAEIGFTLPTLPMLPLPAEAGEYETGSGLSGKLPTTRRPTNRTRT